MMMTTATMISTHGFNMPGFAIVDAASWLVVLVVPDKVEESDDEAPHRRLFLCRQRLWKFGMMFGPPGIVKNCDT
jgi:hypothetical protein